MCNDFNNKKSIISAEKVRRTADLARLKLDDDEQKKILSQTRNILRHFKQISSISTDTLETLSHPYEVENKLRDDLVLSGLSKADLVSLSGNQEDGLLRVPRTID